MGPVWSEDCVGDTGLVRVVGHRVLDGGNEAEVDLARVQARRDPRGHVAHDLEAVVSPQPVHGGGGVEIGDGTETKRSHHSFTTLKTVSRSIGRRPASRMRRTSSCTVMDCAVGAPASWAIFSSVTVPSMSSAPKLRPTWARRGPIMIQYDLMCGKLSRSRRETAMALRSSNPVVSGRRIEGASQGWKARGM